MSWYGLDVDISVCPSGEEQDRSKRMGKSDEYHLRGSRTKQQASVVAQLVKNPPALRETWVSSLGWEDPLENGMATHSSILARRFHGLYSPWGSKELDTTEQLSLHSLCPSQKEKSHKEKQWPKMES